MTKLLLCLTLILGPTLSAAEQDISARTTANKCKSTPCGNTATGEDPQEQRIHEGLIRSDKIRNGDDDQLRWESIRLYSESSSSDKLAMPVIKAAGFEMQLEPKSGHLSFSKQGKKQVFSIASPVDDPSSICLVTSLMCLRRLSGTLWYG